MVRLSGTVFCCSSGTAWAGPYESVSEFVHLPFEFEDSAFVGELALFEFEGLAFNEVLEFSDSVIKCVNFEDHPVLFLFVQFF